MGQHTEIAWTDSTFNPLWGCQRVSAECVHCYAETLANRWKFDIWGGKQSVRRTFGEKYWNEPLKWNREAEKQMERKRVFCGSMCDVFEDHPQWVLEREKLWSLISKTPNLDWLLLTKRPENILKMIPDSWKEHGCKNVWLGTSVGVNETTWRIAELSKCVDLVPVLFLSVEPLIEFIDFSKLSLREINWIIVGGESGHGKRPFEADWARNIRDVCLEKEIAFFMKQMDKVQEIPTDLFIRQFPKL